MMTYRFRNLQTVSPSDVQDGDAFALKIVAVAVPDNTWFAARGPTSWRDKQVAEYGGLLCEDQAIRLFYVMRKSGRKYYKD